MFGSDFPVVTPTEAAEDVRALSFAVAEDKQVFHDTAAALFPARQKVTVMETVEGGLEREFGRPTSRCPPRRCFLRLHNAAQKQNGTSRTVADEIDKWPIQLHRPSGRRN
jgi:hypothetical protein